MAGVAEEAPLLLASVEEALPLQKVETRRKPVSKASALCCGLASRVLFAQLCTLLPIFFLFAYADWSVVVKTMSIQGSFEENFTHYDSERWASPEKTSCQWTEGIEFCESRSMLDFDQEGGVNVSATGSLGCECSQGEVTAGHMKSKAYHLYGTLSFEAAFTGQGGEELPTNGTMACIAGYSVLSKWAQTTHDEMTVCWFASGGTPYLHASWWTGDYLHEIVDKSPVSLSEFHEYEIEWSERGLEWRVDGDVWYTRGNSSTDCGSGLAFEDEYLVDAEYVVWDSATEAWVDSPFFSNASARTGCDFSLDFAPVFEQPIEFVVIVRPYTKVAAVDKDLSSLLQLKNMKYTAFDEESEEYESSKKKWSEYRVSCTSFEGTTYVDGACTRSWADFQSKLRSYTKVAQIAMIILCFGTLTAYLLRFAGLFVGDASTHQRKTPVEESDGDVDVRRWTSIGLLGYLFRDLKGTKRYICYWSIVLGGVVLAWTYPFNVLALWHRLSLLGQHGVHPTFRHVAGSQIVCLFVVMQAFHVVALTVTRLPRKEKKAVKMLNDPAFVARIGYVVPCHKSENEIGRTVRSILDSEIDPKHIVVVDNANSPTPPDKTKEVLAGVHPDVVYVYVPTGLKTNALYVGLKHLPPTVDYVVHLDDDTIIPGADMVYDASHFDDPRVSAVSYGIEIEREDTVEKLVDFEFRLWSHWRYYRARTASAWYCHGIIGMWRRDRFQQALEQHPFMPFGEDGWLGAIVLCDNQRIEQEMRSAVTTFAPSRLMPAVGIADVLPCLFDGSGAGRSQGYGASSVWKQRSHRWFCNAPRRLLIRAFLWLSYDAGSFSEQMLFRVEVLRHVALTLIVILYPIFVARVAYDRAWLAFIELKSIVFATDYLMYSTINYLVWPAEQRVDLKTVLLYPPYRIFLRLALIVGHWRCLTWYMPSVEMRTFRHVKRTMPKITMNIIRDWLWNRAFVTYTHES